MKLCLPSETLCLCLLKASADAGTMSLDSQPQSPELNNSSFFINCWSCGIRHSIRKQSKAGGGLHCPPDGPLFVSRSREGDSCSGQFPVSDSKLGHLICHLPISQGQVATNAKEEEGVRVKASAAKSHSPGSIPRTHTM